MDSSQHANPWNPFDLIPPDLDRVLLGTHNMDLLCDVCHVFQRTRMLYKT